MKDLKISESELDFLIDDVRELIVQRLESIKNDTLYEIEEDQSLIDQCGKYIRENI